MKINTRKIKAEMKRQELSLTGLGKLYKPVRSKHSMWYIIHRAKSIRTINGLADALNMDAKDLLK